MPPFVSKLKSQAQYNVYVYRSYSILAQIILLNWYLRFSRWDCAKIAQNIFFFEACKNKETQSELEENTILTTPKARYMMDSDSDDEISSAYGSEGSEYDDMKEPKPPFFDK